MVKYNQHKHVYPGQSSTEVSSNFDALCINGRSGGLLRATDGKNAQILGEGTLLEQLFKI